MLSFIAMRRPSRNDIFAPASGQCCHEGECNGSRRSRLRSSAACASSSSFSLRCRAVKALRYEHL